MEVQTIVNDTRQQKRFKEQKAKKADIRKKKLVSEVQKGRVVGGLGYQTHITQSFADSGMIDAQGIRVYSKKHFTTFNVDSQVPGLIWEDGKKHDTFGEIKQSLKGEGIIKVHEISDAFKEDYPDCKYGIFYKDGCIPKGDFSKLERYPSIDFVVPESKMKDFLKNPRDMFEYIDFDEQVVDDSVFNKLVAYDSTLTDEMLEYVIESLSLTDKIKMIEAPTGFGKTHFSVHTMFPYFFKNLDVKLIVYVVPQKALMAFKKLYSKNHVIQPQIKFSWNKAKQALDAGAPVILAVTDNSFCYDKKSDNLIKDKIIDLCVNEGYKDKVMVVRDEGHYSGSSGEEFYPKNMGSIPYKYQASMYKACSEILEEATPHVYYLSATPLHEQLNNTFGSDTYALINKHPEVKDLLLRTAKIRHITFNPKIEIGTGKIKRGAKYMTAAVENMINREKSLWSFVDQCELEEDLDFLQLGENHPLKKKQTIIVKLERSTEGKVKLDKDSYVELMESADIQHDFNFVISTGESITVYSLKGGKVTQLDVKYDDEQQIYDDLEDKNSSLRMYAVIEKGSMGVDIPSGSTLLIFRNPKTFFEGSPVTTNGVQLFGRMARLQVMVDDLYKYNWNSKEDFVKYYQMANSFDVFCEDNAYWRATMNEYKSKQGVLENVSRHLYKEL